MPEQDPTKPRYYKGWLVDEIIDLFRLNFRLGNAIKYILREGGKDADGDLRKAIKYLERELYVRHEIQENRGSALAAHVASLAPLAATVVTTSIATEPGDGKRPTHDATISGGKQPVDNSGPNNDATIKGPSGHPMVGWQRVGTSTRVRNIHTNVELGPGDPDYFIAQDLSGGWDAARKATPP